MPDSRTNAVGLLFALLLVGACGDQAQLDHEDTAGTLPANALGGVLGATQEHARSIRTLNATDTLGNQYRVEFSVRKDDAAMLPTAASEVIVVSAADAVDVYGFSSSFVDEVVELRSRTDTQAVAATAGMTARAVPLHGAPAVFGVGMEWDLSTTVLGDAQREDLLSTQATDFGALCTTTQQATFNDQNCYYGRWNMASGVQGWPGTITGDIDCNSGPCPGGCGTNVIATTGFTTTWASNEPDTLYCTDSNREQFAVIDPNTFTSGDCLIGSMAFLCIIP